MYSFQLAHVSLTFDVNDSPFNSDNNNVHDDIESFDVWLRNTFKALLIEFNHSIPLSEVGLDEGNEVGSPDGRQLGFDVG